MSNESDSVVLPAIFKLGDRLVTLRSVDVSDTPFLREVYGSTRAEELAPVPWPEAEKRRFLDQQFAAQDHAYRHNYPGAEFLVVLVDAVPAGRLYLHRRAAEIRIMDIALLPPFRRGGIGTSILRQVQQLATSAGLAVSIHVESFNPARGLYERLGFRQVGQTEVYILLEWGPGAAGLREPRLLTQGPLGSTTSGQSS